VILDPFPIVEDPKISEETIMEQATNYLQFPIHLVRLSAEQPLVLKQAIGLRGYYGAAYGHNPKMSEFFKASRAYRYPRLQYKVVDGQGLILGFAEAAAVLSALPYPELLHLGHQDLAVAEAWSQSWEGRWGLAPQERAYGWLSPWLILDETGLAKYFRLRSAHSQIYFLESLLISNLLAISKELGYHPPAQIEARIIKLRSVTLDIQGRPTLGFDGVFTANLEIPDYFGLGRAASRGYGTVRSL